MKNHIKIQLLALFLLFNLVAFSQTVPEFQFKVKVSDDKGHKDSIIIGYDPLATDTIDASFGEVFIPYTTPFDSLFEVRAVTPASHYVPFVDGYTKKQITNKYSFLNPCITNSGGFMRISVLIRAKRNNFPLTLEFDQSLFVPNSCHDSTLLHWYSETSHPETGPYHLLRNFSSGTIVLPYMASFYEMDKKTYINCYSSSGGVVTDTVYVWKFIMTGYDYYRYLFITSVQDQTNAQMQAYIYPNPAQNEVKVTVGEPAWCYITDISGKTVQNIYVQAGTNSIDLSTVPKGLYIMRLQGKNKFWQQKLIVE